MNDFYLISNGTPAPMQLYLGHLLNKEKSFATIEGVRVGSSHSWPFPRWANVNSRYHIEYKYCDFHSFIKTRRLSTRSF